MKNEKCKIWSYAVLSLLLCSVTCALGQKKIIGYDDLGNFSRTEASGSINEDGKYAAVMYEDVLHEKSISKMLSFKSTDGKWHFDIPNGGFPFNSFPSGTNLGVFSKNDTIGLLKLGSNKVTYLTGIASFKLFGHYLVYKKTKSSRLIIKNLEDGIQNHLENVKEYRLVAANRLLVRTTDFQNNDNLLIYKLSSGQCQQILIGSRFSNITFSEDQKEIALTSDSNGIQMIYYGLTNGLSLTEFNFDNSVSKTRKYKIEGFDKLDLANGICSVKLSFDSVSKSDIGLASNIKITSYLDSRTNAEQAGKTSVIGLVDFRKASVEILNRYTTISELRGGAALITIMTGDFGEMEDSWNKNAIVKRLVYPGGGKKKFELDVNLKNYASLNGKYLIYYDDKNKNFFSYEIATGIKRNITGDLHTEWTILDNDGLDARYGTNEVRWNGEYSLIVKDRYDIWKIDVRNINPPLNMTNGYGLKNHIAFNFFNGFIPENLKIGTELMLSSFDTETKENGLYSIRYGKTVNPKRLISGPYIIESVRVAKPNQPIFGNDGIIRNAKGYLVFKYSAESAPNQYYFSSDWTICKKLTNVEPQKTYNWYKTDLINFKLSNGTKSQGILYKPENFDSKKKYPVIIHYYDKVSENLNRYFDPKLAKGPIDIPFMVSNGYLVFTPDIHFTTGNVAKNILQTIVASADTLSKMSFVDFNHMGLSGHSFGGYGTNVVVTGTPIFAAGCSAAGVSDLISMYGTDARRQMLVENGQMRLNATLWSKPDRYFKNSPIFNADKVQTPMLIQSNPGDLQVPYEQGVEFFYALRRLGKKAWLLSYDGEDHVIDNYNIRLDFTIRMTQFFDHYLKGKQAPEWMTRPHSLSLKSDTINKTPGDGLAIPDQMN